MRYRTEVIGIDEAGRGPLAGPVVVAGVKIRHPRSAGRLFLGIRDSKKLSAKRREEWFSRLTTHPSIEYAVARVWPAAIDRMNISAAANLAALRVYRKLSTNTESVANVRRCQCVANSIRIYEPVFAVLDGGLRLPHRVPHQTIIKGDERVPLIAAASIIAKVVRDRVMIRLHRKFPEYRFDLHKGYGTRFHKELLRTLGRSPLHRISFRF